jgi:hypothetical protein
LARLLKRVVELNVESFADAAKVRFAAQIPVVLTTAQGRNLPFAIGGRAGVPCLLATLASTWAAMLAGFTLFAFMVG